MLENSMVPTAFAVRRGILQDQGPHGLFDLLRLINIMECAYS
jgi:hypothetical protein